MGLNLRYSTWGEGRRTLILLHGFTGNRGSWDHLRPKWEQEVRAIAVDLPGHGESPLPEKSGREGWDETLAALQRLIADVGESEVDLLGYSQGARLALALALRSPDRIRRLVLESVDPGLKRSQERAARKAQDDELATSIEAGGVPAFVEKWEAHPLFEGLRKLPAGPQAALRARRLSGTAQGYAGALRCLGLGAQPSYWSDLPMLYVPTLIITGAQDDKFTQTAKKMTEDMRHAWRKTFFDCGHAPHLEVSDEYASEVLSFICAPYYSKAETFGT
jgi:2-succinyl-6-hydroxy-2,4-cyclohexadiene-1-carboxylate synthase